MSSVDKNEVSYELERTTVPTPSFGTDAEDSLIGLLAECRDAFPVPQPGDPLGSSWVRAMSDPGEVPGYLRAIAASQAAPAPTSVACPTWDQLQALARKHSCWVPGYGPFAAELLATYGAAPETQPHWVIEWMNAMHYVLRNHAPTPKAEPATADVTEPSWEALHHAWMKIGADVAGLDWGAFTNAVRSAPTAKVAPDQRTPANVRVNSGALRMALNVLRRAGKNEVADELEKTAVQGDAD